MPFPFHHRRTVCVLWAEQRMERKMIKFARRILNSATNKISDRTVHQLLFDPVMDNIQGTVSLKPLDVRKFAQIHAAMEAGQFYCDHLYNVQFFASYLDHLKEMAKQGSDLGQGAMLEFGVASGTTLRLIAGATARSVVGFDSFKGLPQNWRDGVKIGAFACDIPDLPINASVRVGLINESLPEYLAEMKEKEINFIHVDTDLYDPACQILFCCRPYMQRTIVVFDEFFNYPGWRQHEFRAYSEFRDTFASEFDFRYIGLGGTAAVSVQITRKHAVAPGL
jgi:hypothetical protein